MNARIGVAALALAAIAVAVIGMTRAPAGDARAFGSRRETAATSLAPAATPASVASPPSAAAAPTVVTTLRAAAPLPPIAPDAAAALALTVRDGDARSPPIAPRDVAQDEPPTTNELADPAEYRRYEARRQARVYRAFEREASIALVGMQRDIARARAAGVPAEQIAEGEEKARVLAETLRKVQDGSIGAND